MLHKPLPPANLVAAIHPPEIDTVEELVDWYFRIGMPLAVPWDAEVTCSDDATAICVYRKPPFQIELYIIHPAKVVPTHGHPGVEVITMTLGGGKLGERQPTGLSSMWGEYTDALREGQKHGGREIGETSIGHALLSFQKWRSDLEVTSASTQWQGDTAGPLQEAMIRARNPNAVIHPGYADINAKPALSVL